MKLLAYIDTTHHDRDLFSDILEDRKANEGIECDVRCFASCQQFLEFIVKQCKIPDLIVCDFNIGKKNGFELKAILNQLPILNQVPFYILSSYTSHDLESEFVDGYLMKPHDYSEFVLIADKFLSIINNPEQ